MAGDFAVGYPAIAAFWTELTGEPTSRRKAEWLVAKGAIPAGRAGGRVIVSKAAAREQLEAVARGTLAPRSSPNGDHESASATDPEAERLPPHRRVCARCAAPFELPRGRRAAPPTRCPKMPRGGQG